MGPSIKTIAWNKGQTVGPKPPLSAAQLAAIGKRIKATGNLRDQVLFGLAVDSSLGATDLVRLQLRDVMVRGEVVQQASILSSQTGHAVQFELSRATQALILDWAAQKALKRSSYLFSSRVNDSPHISVRQYSRLVAEWFSMIGLNPRDYGTQSLRRSKAMLIYTKTRDLDAAMMQLGHARSRSTARYLGLE